MQNETQERGLPFSSDAEKSVLGCMMLDAEAVMLSQEQLTVEDFYLPQHKAIFDAMLSLSARQTPIDLVTLSDELVRTGKVSLSGGLPYIAELSAFMPSTANVSAYIGIVREKSTQRKLIRASGEILSQSYTAKDGVPALLEMAEKSIYDISMRRGGQALTHIKPVLLTTFDHIERAFINQGQLDGVPSGFGDLDMLTNGFHPGEFILVGARPSMGKTSFMLNIAQNAALKYQKKVAYFSLEMPNEQLANRMLCSEARVDMQAVRQGRIGDAEWDRLSASLGELAMMDVYLNDNPGITIPEIRSYCRRQQIEGGLDMIIVDYLQLMSSPAGSRSESRQNEVSDLSRQFKILAQELHVPIIVGSQLSRASQSRADHRPVLSDLRDSGAIEQDADVVMFLHREEYYNAETEDKNVAEVILAKQRNGPLGTVRLAWLGQYTRFTGLDTNR